MLHSFLFAAMMNLLFIYRMRKESKPGWVGEVKLLFQQDICLHLDEFFL